MSTNHCLSLRNFFSRFFLLYIVIYCFPFPLESLIGGPYFALLDNIIAKIGNSIFHIPAHSAFPGFDKVDDSYYGVTFMLTDLFLSLTGALVWSLLDRRRTNSTRMYVWLRLYLRYFLAAYLFGYGFVKFFPSQFQEVTASRLVMEVGEQTPMLLAWNFMGYSVTFTRISGIIEILAGLLLFFRQTTTLGALLATIAFSFIALLNYCFNVPVKLLVSHLLLFSLFLLLYDGRRLLSVLVLNKAVAAAVDPPLFKKESWRKAAIAVKAIVIAGMLYHSVTNALDDAEKWGRYAPRVPLYGIYQTSIFVRNNDTIPPLQTDSLRWKQLVIDGGSWKQAGLVKFSNDQKRFYNITADTLQHTLRLQNISDTLITHTFRFTKPSANQLLLEGRWNRDSIKVLFNKADLDTFNLLSDRFRIVNQ